MGKLLIFVGLLAIIAGYQGIRYIFKNFATIDIFVTIFVAIMTYVLLRALIHVLRSKYTQEWN